MNIKNTEHKYGVVAKVIHWFMALGLIGLVLVGWYMEDMPNSPEKFELYGLHKSFGVVLLALVVLRLVWRTLNKQPLMPAGTSKFVAFVAASGHGLLYAMMFAMPLVGWAMSSSYGFPVSFFGLFTLPNLVAPNKEMAELYGMLHSWGGDVFTILIVGHVLAALYHHFICKDDVLKRMTGK